MRVTALRQKRGRKTTLGSLHELLPFTCIFKLLKVRLCKEGHIFSGGSLILEDRSKDYAATHVE